MRRAHKYYSPTTILTKGTIVNTTTIPAGADVAPQRTRARPILSRRFYLGFAALFAFGVFAQAFFAGAMILISNDWRPWHIGIGHLMSSPIPLIPLLMIILSFVGRLPRADKWLTFLLFVLALLQPFMLYFRGMLPLLGALHPANALLLFVLPLWLIARVRQVMREPASASA
jgi:putative tricarboxylic transport membrane protein